MDYFRYYLYQNDVSLYVVIALIIAVLVLLFLLLRFIWCWYFKINARVRLLERQNALLEEINAKLDRLDLNQQP